MRSWGDDGPAVLFLHGFLDVAASLAPVAERLAGFRIFAPDLRGFGDGDRAPRGSYYHFADYVADVSALLSEIAPGAPVILAGHSMGGVVATLFAGAFPERVAKLASLEGLGPPDSVPEDVPSRMRGWIEGLASVRPATAVPRKEALRRLVMNHPGVPRDVLEARFPELVAGDDPVTWKYDPLHRTTSPTPFYTRHFVAFARRVTCPVLYVSGGATGHRLPDEEERVSAFANVERHVLEGAGHMMHWTQPEALAARLDAFFRGASG